MGGRIYLLVFVAIFLPATIFAWGFGSDPGKVLLRDVNVVTLKSGQMTSGRRSSPVPQLKCVGGSAQGQFNPQVVQCYNRGWDGQDVQWECKSDMDNLYRFGHVEVVCEGYDYPDDPYILKGSCGLEYTLELTKEGRERDKRSSHDYYGDSSYNYGSSSYYDKKKYKSGGLGDLIFMIVVGLVIYAIYKTCISGQNMEDRQYSSTGNDYPGGNNPGGGGGWFNPGGGQNNRGYGDNVHGFDDAACGGGRRHGTGAGGGFWSGLGMGGILGYMFGNRGGYGGYGYGNQYYNRRNYGGGWGSGWGTTGGSTGFSSTGNSGSSGTRTASGFGGTRRR